MCKNLNMLLWNLHKKVLSNTIFNQSGDDNTYDNTYTYELWYEYVRFN